MLENIILKDDAAGSIAELVPGLGFNCHRFAAIHAGKPVEVLYAAANFTRGTERASSSGTPILFPFPGRIAGTTFVWQGKSYPLEAGDVRGNAIHGFVHTRPWSVLEQTPTRVVGQFHAGQDDPSLLNRWPSDFRIRATYRLAGSSLAMHYLCENCGELPLPCGLGTHPYFRLPLGGNDGGACLVRLPVRERWELAEMLPTGRRLALENPGQFAAGQRFADMKFDDVFTGLEFNDGWCRPSIHDPASGATVTVAFDAAVRECVVYTPPHREAICSEPYTSVAGLSAWTVDWIPGGVLPRRIVGGPRRVSAALARAASQPIKIMNRAASRRPRVARRLFPVAANRQAAFRP
jgi:aldose 1-epimerase